MNDKYESIILLVNRAELSMAFDLYNKLTHIGKKALILTKDNTIASDKKFSIRNFQFYRILFQCTYSNLRREAYGLFSSLAEEEANKKLILRELTKYKGVSLWDLSAQYVSSELLPILYDFNMLETVLNFERPCEIHVINGVNNLEKILELICKKRQIPFFIHRTANKRALSLNKFFWKFITLAKKTKRLLVNLRFLFVNLIKSKNLNERYKVVFFASVGRYLASILPVIFKYNNKERLVINTFSSSKKLKEMGIPYMNFYGYKPYSLFNRNARNLLGKIRDVINKNSSFYERLLYKEVTIGPILKNLFEKLIYEVFPHNMQKIDIVRKILLSYGPEVIVVLNSSTDIVLTAKTLSIPVVIIQSGSVIDEFCYFGPIVADTVTVNGSCWKEYLLKKQDVVPDKIFVTGPAKFDVILNKRSNINGPNKKIAYGDNSNAIFSGLGKYKTFLNHKISNSNNSRKTVVFATAYVDLPLEMLEYERIEQFRSVCKAIKNIKEAHLIIKLHPYEKDLKIYKEVVQETGFSNYTFIRNIEMLELLHDCDLLITHLSTAGYEAVLLDKNVISLFGSSKFGSEDIWNFRKYDATIVVDNLGELEKYIRSALFDPETRAKLKKGRKEYIYEHAYKLDGNASVRIKEKIDCFISK